MLLWLAEFSTAERLAGLDGKPGWLETGRGKALAMDHAAEVLRDGATRIRDRQTLEQLAAIDGRTLRAAEAAGGRSGGHDDRALAHILALAAQRWASRSGGWSVVIPPAEDEDRGW